MTAVWERIAVLVVGKMWEKMAVLIVWGTRLGNLIGDLHAAAVEGRKDAENEDATTDPHDSESFFKIDMREANRQIYPGCSKF
jgi:hypothetical protein